MNSTVKKIVISIAVVLLMASATAAILYFWMPSQDETENLAIDFSTCAEKSGSVIMETYPRQCRTEEGQIYIENVGTLKQEFISDGGDTIYLNESILLGPILPPLELDGLVPSTWVENDKLTVIIRSDSDEIVTSQTIATSTSDELDGYVSFFDMVKFELPEDGVSGTLVIESSDGLDKLEIPLIF